MVRCPGDLGPEATQHLLCPWSADCDTAQRKRGDTCAYWVQAPSSPGAKWICWPSFEVSSKVFPKLHLKLLIHNNVLEWSVLISPNSCRTLTQEPGINNKSNTVCPFPCLICIFCLILGLYYGTSPLLQSGIPLQLMSRGQDSDKTNKQTNTQTKKRITRKSLSWND